VQRPSREDFDLNATDLGLSLNELQGFLATLRGQAAHQLSAKMADQALLLLQRLAAVVDALPGFGLGQLGLKRVQNGLGVCRSDHANQDACHGCIAAGEGFALDDFAQVSPASKIKVASRDVNRGVRGVEVLPERKPKLSVGREVVKDSWHVVILP